MRLLFRAGSAGGRGSVRRPRCGRVPRKARAGCRRPEDAHQRRRRASVDAAAQAGQEAAGIVGGQRARAGSRRAARRPAAGSASRSASSSASSASSVTHCATAKRAGGGAAQRRQVRAAAQRLADVLGQRADVGALAAGASIAAPASVTVPGDHVDAWIVTRARRALDLDAGAGVFVQRLAVVLERGVHRRHLVDRAGERARTRRRSRRASTAAPARLDHLAFGVAGAVVRCPAQRRLVGLVGVQAAAG